MIAFDKGSAAAMPAAHFADIYSCKFPATRYVTIQLNGRAVGFILRFKGQGFTFGRPVAIVQKGDRFAADLSTEVVIPNFPEGLLEGWHDRLSWVVMGGMM